MPSNVRGSLPKPILSSLSTWGLQLKAESAMAPEPAPSANATQSEMSLEDYFQHFVLAHQDRMSETELAKRLGISRKSLWERRQRLGIPAATRRVTTSVTSSDTMGNTYPAVGNKMLRA